MQKTVPPDFIASRAALTLRLLLDEPAEVCIMHNPTEEHVRQLEHLAGYMRNFPHLKLIYHRGGSAVADHLSHLSEKDTALASLSSRKFRGGNSDPMDPALGLSDFDYYAGSSTLGRKSISGYCFFVYRNLVTWKSKLQPLTAGSNHEAELVSMSFAADEAVWMCGFAVCYWKSDSPFPVFIIFVLALMAMTTMCFLL